MKLSWKVAAGAAGIAAAAGVLRADPIVWNGSFDAELVLFPTSVDALFGSSVSVGPDLDGDGWADLFVAEPTYDDAVLGLNNSGRVLLFSGQTGTEVRAFGSTEADALSGRSMLPVTLHDGETTISAIAVGSPFQDVGLDRDAGSVLLFDAATGAPAGMLDGVSGSDANHGMAIAQLGDLTGDGMPELGVGATNVSLEPGQVIVYNGATLAVMGTLHGEVEFGEFGRAIGDAGDVNGDGVPDIIVGEPIASYPDEVDPSIPHNFAGQAFIFSGSDFSLIRRLRRPVEHIRGFGAAFGNSVDGVGDINGDGYSEVIVGVPDATGFVGEVGDAYVFDGATGGIIYRVQGGPPASAPRWGTVVRGVGDVDGDAIPDFAVSGTELPLRTIFPAGPGRMKVYSGVNGLVLLEIVGDVNLDAFGSSFDTGDVNGDGFLDYFVGAENANGRDGLAMLFLGQAMTVPIPPCPADLNGDEVADVFDLLVYLDSWFVGDADRNGDFMTDIFDLLDFLDVWFAGC